ncbi:MAG: hypothetical protein IKA00_04030 [Prevotella sp.]|nr:hypothetical protein [Prevotella sp.]MBR3858493.1 hypothetical protein [Bacteroidaceae bacterium]
MDSKICNMEGLLTEQLKRKRIVPDSYRGIALDPSSPDELMRDLQKKFAAVKQSMDEFDALIDRLRPEYETEELEADEYHEDENPTDSSSPSEPELEKIEKESIIRALQRNNGNRKKAAEDLHISERTLLRKIEKYGSITKEVKQ